MDCNSKTKISFTNLQLMWILPGLSVSPTSAFVEPDARIRLDISYRNVGDRLVSSQQHAHSQSAMNFYSLEFFLNRDRFARFTFSILRT